MAISRAGSLLRLTREASGLSLRELASRGGTSAATLSDYEHGRKEPRLSTLERLVKAAGGELIISLHYAETTGSERDVARARELREALGLAESIQRGKRVEAERRGTG